MNVAVFDTKSYDREYLSERGKDLVWSFHECRLHAGTASVAEGADAVSVFVNDQVDAECCAILREKGVRHIALRCAGFNNVDLVAAAECGMRVTRVPSYSPHAVAEHAVALLLTLNRQIHRAHNRVREHNFSLVGLVGFDLFGKTVGIVGTGKIGRITAEIFRGFGCEVLAYDPNWDEEWGAKHSVSSVTFDSLLARSDVVSLHLPLTPQTFHLLDEEAFQRMKAGSYLINTGRGKLVDTQALIAALKAKHLGGVALDVYEEEEGVFFEDLSGDILEDDELGRLLTFPNVLMTSHQAFLTKEALGEIAEVTCVNLARLAAGEDFIEGTEVVS